MSSSPAPDSSISVACCEDGVLCKRVGLDANNPVLNINKQHLVHYMGEIYFPRA